MTAPTRKRDRVIINVRDPKVREKAEQYAVAQGFDSLAAYLYVHMASLGGNDPSKA